MITAIIKARYQGGTYVARSAGFKQTASCTYSTEVAARNLAAKIWPRHTLQRLEREEVVDGVEHWIVQMEELCA
ncbi:hypothetical protein [Azotobacter beijerinckii]|uniref:Uncharacterized protein n=1 Tax=Azotobacter beijerinckii TaxID=170623 RepID=A0A1I1A0G1_9GAMM|nr:hypothetical protein [Azotobacter beijerinckii]SFB30090.1 hypothetical protein SAMN04244571_02146 [Azotobacter beijerinckii]